MHYYLHSAPCSGYSNRSWLFYSQVDESIRKCYLRYCKQFVYSFFSLKNKIKIKHNGITVFKHMINTAQKHLLNHLWVEKCSKIYHLFRPLNHHMSVCWSICCHANQVFLLIVYLSEAFSFCLSFLIVFQCFFVTMKCLQTHQESGWSPHACVKIRLKS